MLSVRLPSLERLFDPDNGNFTPGVGEFFVAMRFPPEQHARFTILSEPAAAAAAGTLSDARAAELDELTAADALRTVLPSKVQRASRRQASAA